MKIARLVTVSLLVFTFLMSTAWAADKPSHSQENCPVMGGKINKDIFVEYEDKKVYFCCAECKGKFNAEPEKYTAQLPQFK